MPIYISLRILFVTAAVLALLFIGMVVTGSMLWSPFDFVVAGILIAFAGFLFEFTRQRVANNTYRLAMGMAIATAAFLIWINLAVGIIGSEDNPANVLYLGTLITLFVGSVAARLRAAGMYRALIATAIAQAIVPFIALIVWQPPLSLGILQVLAVNAVFIALWVGSALLFRQSVVPRGWVRA